MLFLNLTPMLILQLVLIVCLFVAMTLIVWTFLKTGTAPMPSFGKARRAMLASAEIGSAGPIIDLGSGWGTLALAFARKYPDHWVIGYELSLVPYLASFLLKLISRQGNLAFYRRNFFEADLSGAGLLLCYLSPRGMLLLGEKLDNELRGDAHLVSNTFALSFHRAQGVIRLTDLYRTPVYLYHLGLETPVRAGND